MDQDDLEQRLAEALRSDPGSPPGLGGAEMHALADQIAAAGDWDDLLAVRDELRRREIEADPEPRFAFGPPPAPAGYLWAMEGAETFAQMLETAEGEERQAAAVARDAMLRRAEKELNDHPGRCRWEIRPAAAASRHWRFGVDAFNRVLRHRAPASYAVQGLPERATVSALLEVVNRFSWAELDPFISAPERRRTVARERVARGEDLRDAGIAGTDAEPPMFLHAWEPSSYVDLPGEVVWPYGDGQRHDPLPPPGTPVDYDATDPVRALLDEIGADLDDCECVKVRGSALEAIAALGYSWALVTEMPLATMLAHVAYGASWRSVQSPHQGGLADTGRRFAWKLLEAVESTTNSPRETIRWISFYVEKHDENELLSRRFLAIEDPGERVAWAMAAVGPSPW